MNRMGLSKLSWPDASSFKGSDTAGNVYACRCESKKEKRRYDFGMSGRMRGIVHRELIVGEERGERVTVVVTGAGRGEGGGGAETDDG